MPLDFDLFLKVIVYSSDGQQAIDYHYTMNTSSIHPINPENIGQNNNEDNTVEGMNSQAIIADDANVSVYPNPALDFVNFDYDVKQGGRISIMIYNMQGEILTIFENCSKEKGHQTTRFNTSEFTPGLYIIKAIFGDKVLTKRFIIK